MPRTASGKVTISIVARDAGVSVPADLLLYAFSEGRASYPLFGVAMGVAGAGAGMLNSETAKVMQGSAPPQRAGMASGISATTRFVGLLFGVAGLGAVLSHGVNARFVSADAVRALDPNLLAQAAKRVASGDLDGVIGILGESARDRFTLRHRALLRGALAMRA